MKEGSKSWNLRSLQKKEITKSGQRLYDLTHVESKKQTKHQAPRYREQTVVARSGSEGWAKWRGGSKATDFQL